MLAECCYRLIPNGEVIHTHYDSDTKQIIGLPEKFFKTEYMTLPEYSMLNYRVSEVNFAMMTEAVLLSHPEYAIVVETAAIGYTIAEFNGDWRFVDSPLDEKDNDYVYHKTGVGDMIFRKLYFGINKFKRCQMY